jgi:hypothetical protein
VKTGSIPAPQLVQLVGGLQESSVMVDRFSKHNNVGELQDIGDFIERADADGSHLQREIRSILEELRPVKGKNYQELRLVRFRVPRSHVL